MLIKTIDTDTDSVAFLKKYQTIILPPEDEMEKVEKTEFKITADERGWVAWPISEELLKKGLVSNLHVPSIKPGSVRGNHYHVNKYEYLFILSDPCLAVFLDNKTGEKEEILLEGENPVLFRIAPNITHAFRNEGKQDIFLICYDEPSGDEISSSDVLRRVIIEPA